LRSGTALKLLGMEQIAVLSRRLFRLAPFAWRKRDIIFIKEIVAPARPAGHKLILLE
jgi:hypothetical protein